MGVVTALALIPLILPRLHADHSQDWEIRRNLIEIAFRMIKAHPIFGVGPGAYPFHVREFAWGSTMWLWVVHNEFLLVWAERGIFGLIAWLLWVRAGMRQSLQASRQSDHFVQAFGIGCFAALVGLMWEYSLNMWPPYSCYALHWCLFGILVAANRVYAARDGAAVDALTKGAVA